MASIFDQANLVAFWLLFTVKYDLWIALGSNVILNFLETNLIYGSGFSDVVYAG